MHTIKLHVQDSIYEHIMFFLDSINSKKLEIVEDKEIIFDDVVSYNEWTSEELENIGKIGFNSKSFVEDSEDYLK